MLRPILNKIVLALVITISAFFFIRHGMKAGNLYGDALGYYMYLPATFIYNNVETMYDLPKDKGIGTEVLWYAEQMAKKKSPTGKDLNQYTYGIAFMELPFFFVAHTIERIRGHDGTGFTHTYENLLKISSVFYALMGLILVYRILKNMFSPQQSLLGVMLLFIGTNMLWFTLHQAGMSHIPLFFLYAMLMLLTFELHKKPNKRKFIALGLTMGMITIIRPSDILCVLIPLLYNVHNIATFREKILFIKTHLLKATQMIAAFIVPIIPQLLYWKATTGHYLFDSYTGQSFSYWKNPKIIEGLFYFSNGWLPYGPIMIFSLLGLLLYKHFRKWAWCIWFIFPIYIYIIYSWYCFNYINGLGSRPMIHLYPLLAIPFTAFLQFIAKQRFAVKAAFATVCVFCISINIGFSRLKSFNLIRSEESNMAFNFRMFFKSELSYEDLFVKDFGAASPKESEVSKLSALSCLNFDDSTSGSYIPDTVFHSKYLYKLSSEEYSPGISIPYDKRKFGDAKWFRCSGKFMYPNPPDYNTHVIVLDITGRNYWRGCLIENKINKKAERFSFDYFQTNKWSEISYFLRIPGNLRDGDKINLFVWNVPRTELYMDDLCLELYK